MRSSIQLTVALVFAIPSTAYSQESPIRCFYYPRDGVIRCNVIADQVSVSDVVINRGNCESPVLSPDARQKALDIVSQASEDELRQLEVFSKHLYPMLVGNYRPPLSTYKIDDPDPGQQILAAQMRLTYDPANEYKFGEKIVIQTPGCNVLEYRITVDGKEWSWEAR